MNESILLSIKKLLGITSDDGAFDTDIIIHINTAFSVLNQLGVGPKEGFHISGLEEMWSEFLPTPHKLDSVKTYVYLKVKNIFDPPQSASIMQAYNETIKELEWRLNVAVDPGEDER